MPTQYIKRSSTSGPGAGIGRANAAPIYVDSDDNILKMIPAGSGTTEVQVVDASSAQTLTNKTLTAPVITGATGTAAFNTYTGDGAITVATQIAYLTKAGSAAAMTLAAPGAAGIGVRITITAGTSFAHVVTFTGTTLQDGTTNSPQITWTSAAFVGSSLTVIGVTAVLWNIESMNLGATA